MCSFQIHLSTFLIHAAPFFLLRKSRTAGRTRCDCFHTQEVITADLPELWLRLINIDKQLMRCQAGTRPFPSCLPMTPMERKNDLDLAMAWPSFTEAKHWLLIILSQWPKLSAVRLDYSCQRNCGQQMLAGILYFIITELKWEWLLFIFIQYNDSFPYNFTHMVRKILLEEVH